MSSNAMENQPPDNTHPYPSSEPAMNRSENLDEPDAAQTSSPLDRESVAHHDGQAVQSNDVRSAFFAGRRSNRFLMIFLLGSSLLLHLVAIEGIYFLGCRNTPKQSELKKDKQQEQPNTFEISLPEAPKKKKVQKAPATKPAEPKRTASASKNPRRRATISPPKEKRPKAIEIRKATASMLEALGKEHMHLVKQGAFPSLTLSYSSPEAYIQQMYKLGAKTLILQETTGVIYEVDLLKGRMMPLSKKDLAGFSTTKRVIRDSRWNPIKTRFASHLKARQQEMLIILTLPQSVESRWIGHQISVIRQAGIALEQVQGVDALFRDGRLQVVSLHLNDGSERKIRDPGCG